MHPPRRFPCPMSAVVAAFVALASGAAFASGDLSDGLRDGSLFQTSLRESPVFLGERFAWVVEREQLRFVRPGFTVGTLHPGETIVDLESGAPRRLRLSLYNRGDDGALGPTPSASASAFADRLREAFSALDALVGAKGTGYRRTADPTKKTADVAGCRWTLGETSLSLEWALGRDERPLPEYLRLEALPAAEAAMRPGRPSLLSPVAQRRELPRRVRHEADGTTLLDVPMVDQGTKGYCTAASVARVMAYYGFDFLDQHQIASWAETDADRGTNEAMLSKISGVLHDRYKLVYREEPIGRCDLEDLVKQYNREARRRKSPEAVYGAVPGAHEVLANDVWAQFSPDVLRAVRAGNELRNRLFFEVVRKSIDAGVPLVWSVALGLVPEPPPLPQTRGVHVRLIVGYGPDRSLVYSDSWGAGHERKRMTLEDAVTITTGLRTISWTMN